jgi:hypothetical protein
VVGAAVGSNIARNNTHCYYDSGYYDRGYYDRGYYNGAYYGNGYHGGGYARTDVQVYGGDGDHYYRREERREWRDDRRDDRRDWREDRRDRRDDDDD